MRHLDFAGQLPETDVLVATAEGGLVEVRAPMVGYWWHPPVPGTVVGPGDACGELECLGRRTGLRLPPEAGGVVVDHGALRWPFARVAVEYDTVLLRVDPNAAVGGTKAATGTIDTTHSSDGLVFRAPTSGRFYARPRPDADAYVQAGDVVRVGDTVGLLEVMKTFTRLVYQGDGLPTSAVIRRVIPRDDAELEPGDVILELDPSMDT